MKLAQWRKSEKVSQASLASLTGLAQAYISQIEGGHRRPSPDAAKKIEQATMGAVTVSELLGLTAENQLREDAAPMTGVLREASDNRASHKCIEVSIPARMLDMARELDVDVEALILKGGLSAVDEGLKKAFYEQSAKAIDWSRNYVAQHGTLGQRFGIFPTE